MLEIIVKKSNLRSTDIMTALQNQYRVDCRAVGSSFRLGGGLKARAEGPRKFFNLESLKCHFLDFGEDLTEF
jgi:hypothetical protein